MRLDAASHLPRLILQSPHRRVEGVADGDIHILMGVIGGLGPVDHHVLARYADIDPYTVKLALVVMAVRRLDHHGATDDAVVEAFELLRLLADARLDRGGGVHVPKADLQRYRHDEVRSFVVG